MEKAAQADRAEFRDFPVLQDHMAAVEARMMQAAAVTEASAEQEAKVVPAVAAVAVRALE